MCIICNDEGVLKILFKHKTLEVIYEHYDFCPICNEASVVPEGFFDKIKEK